MLMQIGIYMKHYYLSLANTRMIPYYLYNIYIWYLVSSEVILSIVPYSLNFSIFLIPYVESEVPST